MKITFIIYKSGKRNNIRVMTDEQIKQKAEQYAGNSAKHLQQPYEEYKLRYDAYIAGAHSRDKEIKEYQEHVQQLKEYLRDIKNAVDSF